VSRLLESLIGVTGLSEHDIRTIVRNAPVRYKTYLISKRSGGYRQISQPAREVKALQRGLVSTFLSDLPVHPAAMAYRPNISIRDNAAVHAKNGPILKFDFKDFFPSIVARDWWEYCNLNSVFENKEDILLSTNILFHRKKGDRILKLAIGAPSSPCLSNVLMRAFDTRISELVADDQVTYTRYADDLTFSARRTGFLTGVERALRRVLREIKSPMLTINEEKTILATRKYKRMVTGLILTNEGRVSIGHERKRNIRAALHHAEQGKLTKSEQARLGGLLAFVQDVEPEFLSRLIERYGTALISDVKAAHNSLGGI
jgi:RNA-directed DNA polymerase